MSLSAPETLYELALSMLNATSPYSEPVETLRYSYFSDWQEETVDFCLSLKENLAGKRYEAGRTYSQKNNIKMYRINQ